MDARVNKGKGPLGGRVELRLPEFIRRILLPKQQIPTNVPNGEVFARDPPTERAKSRVFVVNLSTIPHVNASKSPETQTSVVKPANSDSTLIGGAFEQSSALPIGQSGGEQVDQAVGVEQASVQPAILAQEGANLQGGAFEQFSALPIGEIAGVDFKTQKVFRGPIDWLIQILILYVKVCVEGGVKILFIGDRVHTTWPLSSVIIRHKLLQGLIKEAKFKNLLSEFIHSDMPVKEWQAIYKLLDDNLNNSREDRLKLLKGLLKDDSTFMYLYHTLNIDKRADQDGILEMIILVHEPVP